MLHLLSIWQERNLYRSRLLQVAVHAIGDRAVDEVLDAYERILGVAECDSCKTAAASHASADQLAAGQPSCSAPGKGQEACVAGRDGAECCGQDSIDHCGACLKSLRQRRHRIEHVQHISSPVVAHRFAKLGVLAVANPLHFLSDRLVMQDRLGTNRSSPQRSFAFGAMQNASVELSFASDWPIVDLQPLLGAYVAAFKCGPENVSCSGRPGTGSGRTKAMPGIKPPQSPDAPAAGSQAASSAPGPPAEAGAAVSDECRLIDCSNAQLTMEDALRLHTSAAAWSGRLEGVVGSLKVGLAADFVVLSNSPLVADEQLPEVLQTYVDGECAFGC